MVDVLRQIAQKGETGRWIQLSLDLNTYSVSAILKK
jgi:hypothetical protein